MVCTLLKAITRWSVATQAELLHKQAAVRVSGCRECLSLSVVSVGGIGGQRAECLCAL